MPEMKHASGGLESETRDFLQPIQGNECVLSFKKEQSDLDQHHELG
jgi:hypothetical protein